MRDEPAFALFVRAEGTALVRTAVLLTGDRADAEDLVQVCLVRLAGRWDRVDDPHAYARTVLARLAVDRWRRLRHRPAPVPLSERDAVGDHTPDTVARGAMLHELAQLPPRQRAVLVLRYYEGWSEAEIATALGCSAGTVKTHAARGLARLRDQLATEGAGL
jgi:RNA polymerase sigma-70 factor (sigma-E family)